MKKEENNNSFLHLTRETALEIVQNAEDAWNSKDPVRVSRTCTVNSEWRHRTQFIDGREEIIQHLTVKWEKEKNYKLKKELWGFRENRMAVRFEYEYQDENEQWYRAYGIELCEFNEKGLMRKRFASINEMKILESDRKII